MSTPETKIIGLSWSLVNESELMDKLCTLSKKGWHLVGYKKPNYLKLWQGNGFLFEKGDAEDRVYRSDYRPGGKASIAGYLQLCEDAGWKNVFGKHGFYIFSAPAGEAAHADFFSDHSSRIAKLKRLRLRVLVAGVLLTPGLFYFYILLQGMTSTQSSVTPTIFTAYVLYLIYLIIKQSLNIRHLQRQPPETPTKTRPKTSHQRLTGELNIIAALTLILMPISAYLLLPGWHWSLHWHIAQSAGLLASYLILRLFIIWHARTQKLLWL